MLKGTEAPEEEQKPKDPMALFMAANEDRDTKIANYKMKKHLENNIERLRDYQDEEMKREFYINQIKLSVMAALDQLGMTEMELNVLKHRASLTQEQHEANRKRSERPEQMQPMQAQYIGVSDFLSSNNVCFV